MWSYIPRIEAMRDYERAHPSVDKNSLVGWDPCSEQRLTHSEQFLYLVELPTGILIGPEGTSTACTHGIFSPILHRLGDRISIRTGWIFTDVLLAGGIWIQWYLIGIWLQRLEKNRKPTLRWRVPVFVISICGLAMTMSGALNYSKLQDEVSVFSALTALLCWLTLLVMFLIIGIAFAFQRLVPATSKNSHIA